MSTNPGAAAGQEAIEGSPNAGANKLRAGSKRRVIGGASVERPSQGVSLTNVAGEAAKGAKTQKRVKAKAAAEDDDANPFTLPEDAPKPKKKRRDESAPAEEPA